MVAKTPEKTNEMEVSEVQKEVGGRARIGAAAGDRQVPRTDLWHELKQIQTGNDALDFPRHGYC